MCAQAGKLDRGVERRPLFEADLHVNDIWASSLIQLSVVEMQAGKGDLTWDGAAGKKTIVQGDIKPQRSSHFSPRDAPLLVGTGLFEEMCLFNGSRLQIVLFIKLKKHLRADF